jgi:hypothetical protein
MNPQSVASTKRSANIFINYRRDDSAGHSGRLFDGLSDHFPGRLFMDIDTIAPGIDFVDAIEKAVGSCEVLIVVIGREWLTLKNAGGGRRVDDCGDFVRLELETALARNIRIIPVLVQDTPPPRAEDLPPSLARLARRNAIELSDARWAYDVDRLARTIQGILGEEAPPPAADPPDPPKRKPPAPAPSGRVGMLRAVSFLLAALVLASAVVFASTRWLAQRASAGVEVSQRTNDASPGNPPASEPPPTTDTPGFAAGASPATSPFAPQAAKPRPEVYPKSGSGQAATVAPQDPIGTKPVVQQPVDPRPGVRTVPSSVLVTLDEPQRQTSTELVAPPLAKPDPEPVRELPSGRIVSPKAGDTVGKSIKAKGLLSGLAPGQRAFLCTQNRAGVIYPQGELFPSADGWWSFAADSSHDDFEVFVVISTSPEAAEALSRSSGDGVHHLPQGAHVVSPSISLNRQGKIRDAVHSIFGRKGS